MIMHNFKYRSMSKFRTMYYNNQNNNWNKYILIQKYTSANPYIWRNNTKKVLHLFPIKVYGTINGIFIQDLSEN